MFDAKKLLDQFLGGTNPDGTPKGVSPDLLKGLAGGAAMGGLAGILLGSKGGKKLAGKAVKLGGTIALASLAYRAYRQWKSSGDETPPVSGTEPMKDITPSPEGTAFLPSIPAVRDDLSRSILVAMIAAAKADGHVDEDERKRIFGRLGEMALEADARLWLIEQLNQPVDIELVVSGATTPEAAVEIYAASVLAIDPDEPAEQAYLATLATRLGLEPGLKTAIEEETRKALA